MCSSKNRTKIKLDHRTQAQEQALRPNPTGPPIPEEFPLIAHEEHPRSSEKKQNHRSLGQDPIQ